MATFVTNMAVTLMVAVLRAGGWFDVYDHRTELREGLEEVVRVTIFNDSSQRAAYNVAPQDNGNARREQVRVGMLKLKTDGKIDGQVTPIDSGWVDIPAGKSIDVSIGAHEAAVFEFAYTWAALGAGVTEPRFTLGAFGGGEYHLITSRDKGTSVIGPDWGARS